MLIVIPNASWAHFGGLHKTSLFALCESLKQILYRNLCFLLKGSKILKDCTCSHMHTHTHVHVHMRTLTQMHAYTHTDTHTHTQPTYTTRTHTHTRARSTVMTGFISRDLPNQWQLTHLDPNFFGGVGGSPTFFLIQSGGLPKTVGLFVGVLGPYLRMDSQYFQQNRRITILYRFLVLCVM